MQVKQLKQDGLSHELEITVEAKEIDVKIDTRLKEVGKTLKMPGFRAGKVPMPLLKQRYGKAILGEVLEIAVNETSQKVMKEKGLQPAIQPKIEVTSFDEGKDLTYTLAVEVLPKITVANYKGLELEKSVARADDKAIDEALSRIAASRKSSQPLSQQRASQKGDIVVIDFRGRTADDDVEHPGMTAKNHHLELGSNQFVPGFEGQLEGKNVGDSIEVRIAFPENYGAAELAGRDAIFEVDIQEIREPKETEINDEFAQSLGMDDVAALRKAVAEQSDKEFAFHSRLLLKKSLLDKLDQAHSFEIPKGMHEMEYNNIMQQVMMDFQRRSGEQEAEISDEEKDELRTIANRRVRLGLVLSEIGKENNIKVSEQELQRAVIAEAQKYPGQEREVFNYFSKNRQALESLKAPIYEDKVVDFILELAKITEKEVSIDELMAEGDDEIITEKSAGNKKSSKKSSEKKSSSEDDSKEASETKKTSTKKKKASE